MLLTFWNMQSTTGKLTKKQAIAKLMEKHNTRVILFEHNIYLFGLYYFTPSFTSASPLFHKEWAHVFLNDVNVLIIAFRESAKTFWLMVLFIWSIVYKKRRNMFYICYDKEIAKERLFDISNHLQTNAKLIEDYWNMFPAFATKKTWPTKRSLSQFITTNGIRCKAMGLYGKVRGAVYMTTEGTFRPDFVGLDDIDVIDSVQSVQTIEKNYRKIKDELFGALADNCKIVTIGNVIKNDGVCLRLEKDYKDVKHWAVFRQAIEDAEWNLSWASRYTKDPEKEPDKISLIKKRADLGEISYNQNFLLIPYLGEEAIFKRHWIRYERNFPKFERVIMGVDPAYSEKKQSDGFAVVVTGHAWNKKYVLDAVNLTGGQKDINKAVLVLKSLYVRWNVNFVNVESVTQEFVAKACKAENMATKNIHPTKDKIQRAMEWQSDMEYNVYFNPDSKGVEELVNQVWDFPNVIHDDLVDAMVYSFMKPKKKAVA